MCDVSCVQYIKIPLLTIRHMPLSYGCLTPVQTTSQLRRCGEFHCWRTLEYQEKTTNLLYNVFEWSEMSTHKLTVLQWARASLKAENQTKPHQQFARFPPPIKMTFTIYPVNEILVKKVFKQNNLNLSRTIVVMTHGNSHVIKIYTP
jgi:hypothetical protein